MPRCWMWRCSVRYQSASEATISPSAAKADMATIQRFQNPHAARHDPSAPSVNRTGAAMNTNVKR